MRLGTNFFPKTTLHRSVKYDVVGVELWIRNYGSLLYYLRSAVMIIWLVWRMLNALTCNYLSKSFSSIFSIIFVYDFLGSTGTQQNFGHLAALLFFTVDDKVDL